MKTKLTNQMNLTQDWRAYPSGSGLPESGQPAISVLAVGWPCVPSIWQAPNLSCWATDETSRALELLRAMRFDLAVTRTQWNGQASWNFIRQMRSRWSGLKWALLADDLTEQQEITARSLGVWRIFTDWPQAWELQLASKGKSRSGVVLASPADTRQVLSGASRTNASSGIYMGRG